MLSLFSATPSFAPAVPARSAVAPAKGSVSMLDKADLEALAKTQNPVIGYYDPLNLAEGEFWEQSNEATIGWLCHAEMKHGRVAMAGFVGYIVHENGIRWPWALSTSLPDYSSFEGLSAPAVWDALPMASKAQIIGVIGIFEIWSETKFVLESDGEKHYMSGGKPGYYPTFDLSEPREDLCAPLGWGIAHPMPFNLYDPFGFFKNHTPEEKAKGLVTEINNGRAAMLGIMGFLSAAKIPGSVPALEGVVKSYSGECMAPFLS